MSDTNISLLSLDNRHDTHRTSMTTDQENHLTLPEVATAISPGLQLRKARENRRISVEAVAAELRVLPKVIEALEGDDYAHLPSPVFVRGYLRNYARAVNLAPEPLIEMYNLSTASDAAVVASQFQEDVIEERQIRWGLYLGVLGTLVLLLLWGGSGRGLRFWEPVPPTVEPIAKVPERDSLPPGLALNDSSPAPAPREPEPAPAVANVESAPASVASSAPQAPTPEPAASPASVSTAAPQAPVQTNPVASSPASQPVVVSEIGQGPDTLTVRLSADSWVAIRDASGQRLVYGNLSAGTMRAIRGQAPFALVIGNSPAAQVEFNGQPVELLKHTKGLVSRMKVTK
ncbi:MAG: transcriptional regulator [Proteobacteria bacterium]|nr:transcriptional regulator [Pseudomonadota bacterium]